MTDKHAVYFLPPRCLFFSEERCDLFVFMGCFLAKNITEKKGSFNIYQACQFVTLILKRLNSEVSHNSSLTLSCFAAIDRQQIHTLCLSGSGQIFWLRLGSWRVTHLVAVLVVCTTHIAPPSMKPKLKPLWFVSRNSRSWAAISELARAALSFPRLEVVLCYVSLNRSIHCGTFKNRTLS